MTRTVDHDLDAHQDTCTEANVLSLTITRTDDPVRPLKIELDTHLHGLEEIDRVLRALRSLQSDIALTVMQGLAEQSAKDGDVPTLLAMLASLMDHISPDIEGTAGE